MQSIEGVAMKAIFGVLGLLIALAVVGVLVKQQLGSTTGATPLAPNASPHPPGEPLQQQIKQSVDAAMQQPRPMPDDN